MSSIDTRLNISSDDLKIYLILLSFGSATKNELASWSEKSEEEVTQNLQILENKGFISRFGGIVEKYTPYYPLGDFIEQLASFKSNITKLVGEALEILQEVHNSLNLQENSLTKDLNSIFVNQFEKIQINEDENKETIKSITEKITQSISANLSTMQNELSSSFENSLTQINNYINDATSSIELNTEVLHEKNSELFTSTKATVTNFIVELHSSTDEAINLFFNEVSDSLETFSQSVPTLVEFFFMESIAAIEKLSETTQKSAEMLSANLINSAFTWKTNTTNFHEALDTSLKNLALMLSEQTGKALDGVKASFVTNFNSIQEVSKENTDVLKLNISNKIEEGEEFIINLESSLTNGWNDLLSQIQSRLSDSISAIQETYKTSFEQISNDLSERAVAFSNSLNTVGEEIKISLEESIKDNRISNQNEMVNALSQVEETTNEELSIAQRNIEENLLTTKNNLEGNLFSTRDALLESINTYQEELKLKNEELGTNTFNFQTTVISELEDRLSQANQSLMDLINENIDFTKKITEETTGDLIKKTEEGSTNEIQRVQNWIMTFDEKYQEFLDVLQQQRQDITDLVSTFQTETKTNWEGISTSLVDSLNEYNLKIENSLSTSNETLNLHISDIKEKSKANLDGLIKENIEIVNKIQGETTRNVEGVLSKINESFEEGVSDVNTSTDQINQKLREMIQDQFSKVKETLNTTSENFKSRNDKLLDMTNANMSQFFKTQIVKLQTETQLWKDSTNNFLTGSSNEIDASLKLIDQDQTSSLQEYDSTSKGQIQQLETMINKLNELQKDIISTQTDYLNRTQNNLNETKDNAFELIEESQSTISSTYEEFKTNSSVIIQNSLEEMKENISKLQQSIENLLEGIKTGVEFRLNEIENSLGRTKESYTWSFNKALEDKKRSFESIRESSDTISSTIDSTKSTIQNKLDSISNTQKDSLEEHKTQLVNNLSNVQEEIQGLKNLKQSSEKALEESKLAFENTINETQVQSTQTISQISTFSQETLDSVRSKVDKGLKQSFSDVNDVVNKKIPSIFKTGEIDLITQESEKLGQLFTDLLKEIRDHPRPDEYTQFIHSKEAILMQINHWLDTAKAGVNIIVPSYTDLDMNVLKEIPMRRRVTIYTNTGDRTWMEPFVDKSNIRFFHLETGKGTQLPPIFAVDRESEEILFAPASDMKSPMGILSSEGPYINAIANNLMSQYMAMARKVDPGSR